MTDFNSFLKQKIEKSADFDFQGLKVTAYKGGRNLVDLSVGKTYDYYDVASLTKIFFTTLWFMDQQEQDAKILRRSVQSLLPWYAHSGPTVGGLLNHSAGNNWWQPFYKEIAGNLSPEQSYQQMESLCRKAPLSKNPKAVYSDIDFYLLGSIMQKIEGTSLARIWERIKKNYYSRSHFHFNCENKLQKSLTDYAPTEKCLWRKKIMRGQVHDENCWALGGMAPHAGLFGRISDLSLYGNLMRKIWRGQHSRINALTLKKFSSRSLPESRGDWGYGFMVPSLKGSSAGELFNKSSFGHTGFTGTSFWFDHQRDLFVGILSNRVYPTRENKGFVRLRPQIHDWIVQKLEGKND